MWKKLMIFLMGCGIALAADDTFRQLPVFNWEQRSDWVNVKDFGAVGDGKTDDSAALQKAFDKLEDGVTIYLPPGKYILSRTLEWKHPKKRLIGTTIIGHGEETQLVWNGARGGRIVRDSGLSLCKYIGIVFDGRNNAAVGMWNDQEGKFETQARYLYLAFRNIRGAGILCENNRFDVYSDAEPTFENCIFDNVGTGVEFSSWNDYNFSFKGCLFINNRGSGISCRRGCFYVMDCRFENNGVDIIADLPEHGCSVRRSVSYKSGRFLRGASGVSPLTIENCTVSSWTSEDAIQWKGSLLAFNNVFKSNEAKKVVFTQEWPMYGLAGNKHIGNDLKPYKLKARQNQPQAVELTAGKLPPLDLAESANFLAREVRIPGKVFDAIRDFGAKGDGKTDDSEAIIKTIATAKAHGNNAIAYFPTGKYKFKQPVIIDGAGYFVGGTGSMSVWLWDGDKNQHAVEVVDPENIVMEYLRISNLETLTDHKADWNGEKGANIVQRSGSKPTFMTYNGILVYGKYQPAGAAERQGILFENLKVHDVVNMRYLEGNQRYINAGDAIVLGGVCHEGSIVVDGFTGKGFISNMVRLATHMDHPLLVRKNASFVLPDFYMEQGYHILISLSGGTEYPPGRVTLGLPKFAREMTKEEQQRNDLQCDLIRFDNYHGTLNLLGAQFYKTKAKKTGIMAHGGKPELNIVSSSYYDNELVVGDSVKLKQAAPNGFPKNFAGQTDATVFGDAFDDCTRLGQLDLKYNYPNLEK